MHGEALIIVRSATANKPPAFFHKRQVLEVFSVAYVSVHFVFLILILLHLSDGGYQAPFGLADLVH
jgi:hypothetical protein